MQTMRKRIMSVKMISIKYYKIKLCVKGDRLDCLSEANYCKKPKPEGSGAMVVA